MSFGGRGSRSGFFEDLKKIIAYYPLTFYVGLTIILISALLVYLQLTTQWQFSIQSFFGWVNDHQTILLTISLFMLGTTLFASAVSYKKVCNLSQQDYLIWLQQRSTRTLFPFFTPLHDWFRLRFAFYRWWHTQVISSSIHVILLIVFITFSLSYYLGPNEPSTFVSPGGSSGSATALVVTGITDPTQAGVVRSVTVEAVYVDFGETLRATDYRGTVTFSSSDGQAILPGDYTFTAGDAGIHTFTNSVTLKTVGEQSVTATTVGDVTVAGSQTAITVTAAAVASFTVSGITSPTTAGTARSVTVTAKDAYGNTVTSYTGTITFTSSDAQATLPSNYTFVGGDSGTHTFTNGVTLKTAGTRSVTATQTGGGGITGSQTGIVVNAASVASFTVSGITSPTTAGTARSVTVTAKDAYSNTVTSYTGTITFTSSDAQATLPSNYTFVGGDSGTHTFTNGVTLKTVGTQSVTATQTGGGGITGSQTGIVVNAAAATTLTVSGITSPTTAGTARSVTVTAKDAYNNTATGYTGTITFTSSDAQATLPSNYTFVGGDSGTHTFTNGVTLKTAGTQSVTATDTVTGTITGSQTGIVVNPASATSLEITNVSLEVTAGDNLSPIVTLYDDYSNVATSYTGTIDFTSSDAQATLPSNYTFVGGDAGTHTFTNGVILKTAGSITLTVTDTIDISLTDSLVITVNPDSATTLELTNLPSSTTAGTALTPIVTAYDAYSNVATGYIGTITFTSSDAQATLPSNYTFVGGDAGTHTFTNGVILKTSGVKSVSISDGTLSDSVNVTVSSASANELVLTTPSTSVTAGTSFSVTAQIQDLYGNTVTSYTGTVAFTSNDVQATLPNNYTFVGGDSGTHTFTNGVTLKTVGTKSVTVTDINNSNLTDSLTFTVSAGELSTYTVVPEGFSFTAGTKFSVTVTALDGFNNVITTNNEEITASSTNLTFYNLTDSSVNSYIYQLSSGVTEFDASSLIAGTYIITVTDASDNTGTSDPITITSIPNTDDPGDGSGGTGGTGGGTGGGTTDTPTDDEPSSGSNNPITVLPKITKQIIKAITPNNFRQPLTFAAAASSALGLITFAPFASAIITWLTNFTINGASLFNLSMLSIVRSRRRKWGRVENGLTGKPIPGVFVELYNNDTKNIVDRVLTDKSGEFAFLVERSGKYHIQIQNPLYEPYISEVIKIEHPEQDVVMEYIILHPIEEKMVIRLERTLKVIKLIEFLRIIQWPVLIAGSFLAIALVYTEFTYFRMFVLSSYLVAWILKYIEIQYRRPFGVVTDRLSNEPQMLAVAQLEAVNEGRGKIVRSTITDNFGRFIFIVKKNTYRLNIAKIGYTPKELKIDGENINLDVRLDRDKVN
ncbi:hypothetical protein HY844_00620 [Candidatus Berkelbacteria bacterium]|nr:hypothetical protein [Candidatus Berkelbacteria bacterium]